MMDFLHGCCFPFAQALHDVYGVPAYGIWEHDEEEDTFVHAFCELPNGDVIDVRGITDNWDAFLDDFDDWIFDRDDMDIQSIDSLSIDSLSIAQCDALNVAVEIIRAMPQWYCPPGTPEAKTCTEPDFVVY